MQYINDALITLFMYFFKDDEEDEKNLENLLEITY
jgi:hypothetical protein